MKEPPLLPYQKKLNVGHVLNPLLLLSPPPPLNKTWIPNPLAKPQYYLPTDYNFEKRERERREALAG
jgi:hypothetical protein